MLLAWRWPWLLAASEFNPDESQIIAGAMALAHDPVFWRSVDGTTSGPLNYYPLVPIAWLDLPMDFFTGRLAGLLMVGGGCVALYRALAHLSDEAMARIGVLPVVLFFATAIDPDFVHYSSEHVILLLAPISLWLIARSRTSAHGGAWNLRAAAVAAGAIPWAKLQGVPLALVLLLWIAWLAWVSAVSIRGRLTALAAVTLAGAAPSLAFAGITAAGSVFDMMLHRYVLQNATYVDVAINFPPSLPGLLRRAAEFGQFLALALFSLLMTGLAGLVLVQRRRWPNAMLGVALVWVAAAIFAIALPRREFLHYLLLAVVPLGLMAALALREICSAMAPASRRTMLALFLVAGVAVPLARRATQGVPFLVGALLDQWRFPYHADGAILRSLRRPGDTLAIWGWSARTYIEAGMPQATRDTHTFWATGERTSEDPHRRVYLADFLAHRPPFFVDATGEGAFFYDRRDRFGHEDFPELAAAVRRDYSPLIDLGYARVYIRNDRRAAEPLTPLEIATLATRARRIDQPPEVPAMTLVGDAHYEMIAGHNVLVLPAPARAYVLLDPSSRALELQVAFHPRAVAEGVSDGAEIALELVDTRGERRIFQERLNFGAATRLERRITLPPFAFGTHLQIRALPGPAGNNAWDWLCIENLRPVRRSFYAAEQFPHFDRLPSIAEFDAAELSSRDRGVALRATAPGKVEFPLTATDRHFTLALRSAGPGEAELIVERVDEAGMGAILARSALAGLPRRNGAALMDLALPASTSGDRLRLSFRTLTRTPVLEFERVSFH
ncbi:hypothetical protein [Oleiharenicola sp. Vm1]|uniref:hypothetical protein n=1 Tax=Oleiharenicola sp. Vm1 TaxID=3398393 RepID=UPI0039F5F958